MITVWHAPHMLHLTVACSALVSPCAADIVNHYAHARAEFRSFNKVVFLLFIKKKIISLFLPVLYSRVFDSGSYFSK